MFGVIKRFEIMPGQSRATASCMPGCEATGGGYLITGFPGDYQSPYVDGFGLDISTEAPTNHPTTWFIEVYNGGTVAPITGRLYVMCIEVSS